MKKYKPLPTVIKDQYEVVDELTNKKYKLTEESQLLQDKAVTLLLKQRAREKSA